MLRLTKIHVVLLVFSALVIGDSIVARASEPIVFYRNHAGDISAKSRADARVMRQIARQQGYITLWLTANFAFNVRMHEMTQEEIAEQDAQVASAFGSVLDPLVAEGDAWHPPEGPFIKGPGCNIRATHRGLERLLHDDRIIQIVAMEVRPKREDRQR